MLLGADFNDGDMLQLALALLGEKSDFCRHRQHKGLTLC